MKEKKECERDYKSHCPCYFEGMTCCGCGEIDPTTLQLELDFDQAEPESSLPE